MQAPRNVIPPLRCVAQRVRRGLLPTVCLAAIPAAAWSQTTILTNPAQFSGTERLITFEDCAASLVINRQYEPFGKQGVVFTGSTASQPFLVNDALARQFPPAGTRALTNAGAPPNNVVLTFNSPMNRVGFEVRTLSSGDDVKLSLQCSCGGAPLAAQCFTLPSTGFGFVAIESVVPFDQIVIDAQANNCPGTAGVGAFRMDNLRFEGPPTCKISTPIHESATFVPCEPSGTSCGTNNTCQGGSSVFFYPAGSPFCPGPFDCGQFLGSRFSVDRTVLVTAVGGHLEGFNFQNRQIFAAIVSLAGPTALPIGNPLDSGEIVAGVAFDPGRPDSDVRVPLSAVLTPGDYALVFGGGMFGADGDASLPATGAPLPGNSILLWNDQGSGPVWQDIGTFGARFVVEADTVFEQGSGATTSFTADGSGSSNAEPGQSLTYAWTTNCTGLGFDDASLMTPTVTVDTPNLCPAGSVDCELTLTVTDGQTVSGVPSTSTCSAPVHIDDLTAPLLTVPANASVDCSQSTDPSETGTATATDQYDPAPSVTYADDSTAGTCAGESTIIRTWTATDSCGNSSSGDQTISTTDAFPPNVTCPPNATSLACTADTSVGARGSATALDECGPASVSSEDVATSGCGTTTSIVRTWTATDGCNNSASCDQLISTVDTTAPSVTCPPNATGLPCGSNTSVAALGSATASDDCGAASVTSSDSVTTSCGSTVSISRTWSATDACNNSASCVQSISTVDTTPPVLSVNTSPITVTDTNCSGSEVVTLPVASATDGCSGSVPVSNNAPTTFPAGTTTTVHYQASDACGNSAGADLNVKVRDGAHILASAAKFVVGLGHHPSVQKHPIPGIVMRAYVNSSGSCARQQLNGNWGLLVLALPDIIAHCTPVTSGTTNAAGEVLLDVPPGDYIVATYFDSDGDSDLDQYLGDKVQNLSCGETDHARLFMVVVSNGQKYCGKWHYFTGSELIIVEPEEVLWDGTEQLYPFVFDSVGDWGITVSVAPPEGFVSDYPALSEEVSNEVSAVQFTVTEVGSDLVPTRTEFVIRHKGQARTVRSSVDIRLTAEYAKSRGFDPVQLEAQGLIREPVESKPTSPRDFVRPGR